MPRDSTRQTLLVATVLCVVCSVLVSGAAVGLRGFQEQNKRLDQQKNILIAAGLFNEKENTNHDVPALFDSIDTVLIDLETGEVVDASVVDPKAYNQRSAAKDPELSQSIAPEDDLAGIKQREKYAFVYQVKMDGKLEQIVLPINGKGLWSTLYGFLALDANTTTVRGITFYEHAETPGLGGEVENPQWKALWPGKKIFGDALEEGAWEIKIEVVKGAASTDQEKARHQVDGLSGATITSRGVSNLVRYWLGHDAFGPYLDKLRHRAEERTEGGSGA